MNNRNEQDDIIAQLMRKEGLLSPSPEFTGRVMLQIEESRQKSSFNYKPLITRNTWIMIAIFLAALLVIAFYAGSGSTGQPDYSDSMNRAMDFLSRIHLPFTIDSGILTLATAITTSIGILLIMDFLLGKYLRQMIR